MRLASISSQRFRADWLPRSIVAGFSAAAAMMFAFLLGYVLALALAAALPEPLRGWFEALANNPLTDFASAYLYAVAGAHFLVALVLAAVYGRYAEPALSGPGWRRGALFSLLPWLVSVLVVLPLGGGGLFGLALGAGPLPALGNLVLHLVYGATLGAIYGPLGDVPADSAAGPSDDFETTRRREVRSAQGIGLGLAIGLVAGLAVVLIFQAGPSGSLLSLPGAGTVLGWTLIGGALGALLGTYAGMSPGN